MWFQGIFHFVVSVNSINRPLRKVPPISVSDMSLEDVTSTLLVGNEDLFSGSDTTDPVAALSHSDRIERHKDIPDMVRIGKPAEDYFTNLWKWIKDIAGLGPVPFLPYPLYTVDYLNGAVYKRVSDPSDSQDPTLAGDIIIQPDWSKMSVPSWNVWPQPGNITYVFESMGSMNQTCSRIAFHEALERIRESSGNCFGFTEIPSPSNTTGQEKLNPLRVIIDSSPRCFASLGYNSVQGGNILNVGAGCANVGTIMHLLGHVLGMAHEEQRPDAGDYVSVMNTNIDVYGMSPSSSVDPTKTPKFQYVFTPLNGTGSAWEREVTRLPYEYGSLMQNSMFRYSFSLGNNATLKAVHQGVDYADLLGNRGYFTSR
jgi:hypothetical protein